MTCQHRPRDTLDVCSATDVANLVLHPEFVGEPTQAVLAAREQYQTPAFAGERAGDCLADATRRARDDRYALVIYRQTFT